MEQSLGLLRRMGLVAVVILQALIAGADGQYPVRPHLHAVIQRLQRLIVEGVFRRLIARGPDQRFMGVGQALSAEIGHGVRLAPDHVVQHPETQILQRRAHPEDVVIAADHPDRPIGLEQAARGGQPVPGELVIGGKARELIPMIIDRIDLAVVRPMQFALQLKVVGRIRENQIHRVGRKRVHLFDAIAGQYLIERQGGCLCCGFACRHYCLCSRPLCADLLGLKMSQRGFAVKFFFESRGY